MARKKAPAPAPKQERIEGTFDPIPEEVQLAADEYVHAKRKVAEWREMMNGRKETLIEAMTNHDVRELDIDDGDKRLVLDEKLNVSIKKKSDPKPGTDDSTDADAAFA